MGTWEIIKAVAVVGAFVYRTVKKHKDNRAQESVAKAPPAPPRGRRK